MTSELQTPDMSSPNPPPTNWTPLWISLAALGGLLVGVAGTLGATAIASAVISVADQAADDSRLAEAVDSCGTGEGIELDDGDRTLVVDVQGEDEISDAGYVALACILGELDVPRSVTSHIEQTTSMDGRQTESWDGITIEWSYHPDRGSDMVITLDDPE